MIFGQVFGWRLSRGHSEFATSPLDHPTMSTSASWSEALLQPFEAPFTSTGWCCWWLTQPLEEYHITLYYTQLGTWHIFSSGGTKQTNYVKPKWRITQALPVPCVATLPCYRYLPSRRWQSDGDLSEPLAEQRQPRRVTRSAGAPATPLPTPSNWKPPLVTRAASRQNVSGDSHVRPSCFDLFWTGNTMSRMKNVLDRVISWDAQKKTGSQHAHGLKFQTFPERCSHCVAGCYTSRQTSPAHLRSTQTGWSLKDPISMLRTSSCKTSLRKPKYAVVEGKSKRNAKGPHLDALGAWMAVAVPVVVAVVVFLFCCWWTANFEFIAVLNRAMHEGVEEAYVLYQCYAEPVPRKGCQPQCIELSHPP